MINNVTLIGRLTKDVELKRTPSDIATASCFKSNGHQRR